MNLDKKYKQPLIEDLCEFIRIPSRSCKAGGEEGALQRVVAQKMEEAGARVRMFETDEVPGFRKDPLVCGPGRDYNDRPTVLGEIGPENAPALLILAHSDTVEIFDRADWTFDPFCGEVREGRIRGLGACDDKWGTATMITLIRAFSDSGRALSRRLIFASTIDEESGVGNGTLLLTLAGIEAEAALYLDGGQLDVCVGNLGGSNLRLEPGKGVSKDDMKRHARLLDDVCREMSRRRASMFELPFFDRNPMRDRSVILYHRTHEAVPFFMVAFYTLPGEDGQNFRKKLEQVVEDTLGDEMASYDIVCRKPWFEPSRIPADTPLIRHLSDSIRHAAGQEPNVTTISKQDCFVLNNRAGIPTVSFGSRMQPEGRGSYHQPDEYIGVEELWLGCRIAYETAYRWLKEG